MVVLSGFTSPSLGNSGTQRGLASPRVSSAALNSGAVSALAHLFREALHCSKTGQKHGAEPQNCTPCLQIQERSRKCKLGSQALLDSKTLPREPPSFGLIVALVLTVLTEKKGQRKLT